jgi:hypothetical protein
LQQPPRYIAHTRSQETRTSETAAIASQDHRSKPQKKKTPHTNKKSEKKQKILLLDFDKTTMLRRKKTTTMSSRKPTEKSLAMMMIMMMICTELQPQSFWQRQPAAARKQSWRSRWKVDRQPEDA